MDRAYVCYTPPPEEEPVGPLPSLQGQPFTFGCFNNHLKINHRVLHGWSQILAACEGSRLFLKTGGFDDPGTVRRLMLAADKAGISRDRLIVEGKSSHPSLMKCYHRVDVALDPFPYSGGLTTLEALWMGVPVVSCPGDYFASRHAASHLIHAGLPECVTRSVEAYHQRAVDYFRDPDGLASLREGLRARVEASTLRDPEGFARELERKLFRSRERL